MNDKDKLLALIKDFGLDYKSESLDQDAESITLKGEKVTGYWDFFTEFIFDKDGKFVSVGAWE